MQDVIQRKPYMSVGIAVLEKKSSGSLELVYMKEFAGERQVELDIELEPGEYLILPRSSGCHLRRPENAPENQITSLIKGEDLNEIAALTVKDIFRRLDKHTINNNVEFDEFKGLYDRLGKNLTEKEFKEMVLDKYCNNDNGGVNKRGFMEFFEQKARKEGENVIWDWFEKCGYDRDLYPIESRTFMLTIHSLQ